jgi:hypothetical protein
LHVDALHLHHRLEGALTQPHCSASGTADSALVSRSISAWVSTGIWNETASLNLKCGPPLSRRKAAHQREFDSEHIAGFARRIVARRAMHLIDATVR